MTDAVVAEDAAETKGERQKDRVASVAARIPALSTGDRALLRRMPAAASGRAAGVVVGLLERAELSPEAMPRETFHRWALLAHVAAVLSGTGRKDPHSPKVSLGRALFAAGYSENRLMRLTAARGDALYDQIVRAARYLAAAGGAPVDLRTLHGLTDPDDKRAEAARLDLARGFYAAEYAETKKGDDESDAA